MGKIKCPICGQSYSGTTCPDCGAPAPRKKKKKLGWVILAVVLVLAALAAIGGSEEPAPTPPSSVSGDSSVSAAEETPEDGQEEPVETEGEEPVQEEQEPAASQVTLEAATLYDQDGVTVTAEGLDLYGIFGPEIQLNLKNDADQNLIVTSQYLSVNGSMMGASAFYVEVAAGKSAVDSLILLASDLEAAGIDTLAEIAFYVSVLDGESYQTIDTSELVTLSTSAAGSYQQVFDTSGDLLYDDQGIRVICQGRRDDTFWDGKLVLFIENNSERPVSVYAENLSVNGVMADQSMWADLRPGTNAYEDLLLWDLESIGLEDASQIQEMEFTLRIVDAESWQDLDTTDPIQLTFDTES